VFRVTQAHSYPLAVTDLSAISDKLVWTCIAGPGDLIVNVLHLLGICKPLQKTSTSKEAERDLEAAVLSEVWPHPCSSTDVHKEGAAFEVDLWRGVPTTNPHSPQIRWLPNHRRASTPNYSRDIPNSMMRVWVLRLKAFSRLVCNSFPPLDCPIW
jgi:hypothetical protein